MALGRPRLLTVLHTHATLTLYCTVQQAITRKMQNDRATAASKCSDGQGRQQGLRASVRRLRIGASGLAAFRFDFAAHSMPLLQGYHVCGQNFEVLKPSPTLETGEKQLHLSVAIFTLKDGNICRSSQTADQSYFSDISMTGAHLPRALIVSHELTPVSLCSAEVTCLIYASAYRRPSLWPPSKLAYSLGPSVNSILRKTTAVIGACTTFNLYGPGCHEYSSISLALIVSHTPTASFGACTTRWPTPQRLGRSANQPANC
ncbi:uncharacterized protein RSE6_07499 [Rhynchosporium secalis]|uniref:Uncharacterized protein n=1 Tax=Rhynchosporium secalis TaxID=38038 RepID=A0A1E1MD01_RHYSE|nr:uncharacterized protein RSE6_07499 [Rhynchosporium secalis]